jgi:hypothetical protein
MVKEYNKEAVCPKCFSTVESFGKGHLDQWRCTNPLCTKSKFMLGYLTGEKLIPRKNIIILTKAEYEKKLQNSYIAGKDFMK